MTELKDLAKRDVVVQLYQKIKASKTTEETPTPRETKAVRMAKWSKSVEEMSPEDLDRLDTIMEAFVPEKFARVQVLEARLLEQDEIDQLASEFKDMEYIKDAIEARRLELRRMVFTHINTENIDDEEPEMAKGAVISEKEKLAFKREGGTRGTPTILWEKLKEAVPAVIWEKLVRIEIIPATVLETPSEERLLDLVESGEIDIETLRPFIQPGSFSPVKFVPRPIK